LGRIPVAIISNLGEETHYWHQRDGRVERGPRARGARGDPPPTVRIMADFQLESGGIVSAGGAPRPCNNKGLAGKFG